MAKIGIQLYTVRDLLEKDYVGTIKKMKSMGYEGVELPGGAMKKISPEILSKVLEQESLELAGITFEHDDFIERMEELIVYCKSCNCTTVVYPWIPQEKRQDAQGYRFIAEQMNAWAKKLHSHGIKFLYHIHGYEFEKFEEGCGFDAWIDAADMDYVKLEIDVYWVEYGGEDSIAFMEKYGSLSPSIHFKDCTDVRTMKDTEVGNGCINMVSVAEIGLKNRAEWFIVEQEQFDKPSVESARISRENLTLIRKKAQISLKGRSFER